MDITEKKVNLIFLVLFTAYAVYSVIYQSASLFFIIYLFWFDEVVRSISLYFQVKLYKEDIRKVPEFPKYIALDNVKSQFFFLFIYSIFIIIVFGIFFYLGDDTKDELVTNVRIFLFKDISFNMCIMISIIREILKVRIRYLDRLTSIPRFSAMNGHLLTLHVSIIFGGLAWAVTSGKFSSFHLDLGVYNRYAVAIPFFVTKFLVDLHQINRADDGKKTLLENLQ